MKRFLILPLLFAAMAAQAASVTLKAPPPKKITLAKAFTLTYVLAPPANYSQVRFNKESVNIQDFEVLALPCENKNTFLECSLKVTPFALDKKTFTGPEWNFTSETGTELAPVKAEDIEINIAKAFKFSLKKDIKEIRGHYYPFNIWKALIIISIILALILLYLYYLRRKNAPLIPLSYSLKRELELPIDVLSRNQINFLLESGVWEAGEYKKFYFSLTDIFRNYLHKRFNLSAEYQTSAELLKEIKASPAKNILDGAKALLTSADLVKFAKVTPNTDKRDLDVQNILSMIEQTTPQPIILEHKEGK